MQRGARNAILTSSLFADVVPYFRPSTPHGGRTTTAVPLSWHWQWTYPEPDSLLRDGKPCSIVMSSSGLRLRTVQGLVSRGGGDAHRLLAAAAECARRLLLERSLVNFTDGSWKERASLLIAEGFVSDAEIAKLVHEPMGWESLRAGQKRLRLQSRLHRGKAFLVLREVGWFDEKTPALVDILTTLLRASLVLGELLRAAASSDAIQAASDAVVAAARPLFNGELDGCSDRLNAS